MKHLSSLFFLFICSFLLIQDVRSAQLGHVPINASRAMSEVTRKEVSDISAIGEHASNEGKIAFFVDADEVLFTSTVTAGEVSLVRLYQDLEGLFSVIRQKGHLVYIMTYNTAAEIRRKLKAVNLPELYFNGILSCEMQGDLMTAKGDLLRRFVKQSGEVQTAVFIDNFPPFVENVENVARELGITLYSYLATGYIPTYHNYVYHCLCTIDGELGAGKDVSSKLNRIQKSLEKYELDLSKFKQKFPTFEKFKAWANQVGLIWPYLTYL